MVDKKLILKEISFFSRIVVLVALIFSLIFYDKYVFSTFFIIAGCLEICDCLLSIKEVNGSLLLNVFSTLVGRCIFFVPLLFLTIYRAITVWVLLILVFFEIVIALYKKMVKATGKAKKIINIMYFLYIILLWLSIFIWCFNSSVATYLLVSCSVLAGLYIIYCSVIIGNESDEKVEVEYTKTNKNSEIEDNLNADKNQIIE